MSNRLFRRLLCNHAWKCTYVGLGEKTYTYISCGKARVVKSWNEGKWIIRQKIKGGRVDD